MFKCRKYYISLILTVCAIEMIPMYQGVAKILFVGKCWRLSCLVSVHQTSIQWKQNTIIFNSKLINAPIMSMTGTLFENNEVFIVRFKQRYRHPVF
jgi:hypothetical protein